jgi:serine/threonine-protein kinase
MREVTQLASLARMGLSAGTVFAERYEIVSLLGRGGMGSVYRANHLGLRKHVALKVLDGTDHEARFDREARAIARLDHPSCVRVLDCGRDDENWRPYIAMELLDGPTLLRVLRDEGRLSTARAVAIARDLLTALAHAHVHGVLHRDLKPENVILVHRDGAPRAVLIDFGLAHLLDEAGLTARGMCIGSPSYLAPERLAGLEYDARADIYGVGVLLYEMLAGEKPFTGASTEEILLRCRDRPARPLRAIRKDVSRALDRVVSRAMAKDPGKRFADADEMLAALDDVPVLEELAERTHARAHVEQITSSAIALLDLRRASLWSRLWSWLRFGRWRWT